MTNADELHGMDEIEQFLGHSRPWVIARVYREHDPLPATQDEARFWTASKRELRAWKARELKRLQAQRKRGINAR